MFEIGGHKVDTYIKELGMTVGEALLQVHINYSKPVLEMLDKDIDIHGIAHITGGGFTENIPRVLPSNLDAEITLNTWPILPIFSYMQKIANISEEEMYRAFNMGIGLMLIIPKEEKTKIDDVLKNYPQYKIFEVGKIISGNKKVVLK